MLAKATLLPMLGSASRFPPACKNRLELRQWPKSFRPALVIRDAGQRIVLSRLFYNARIE
jgi:hypothetical protein